MRHLNVDSSITTTTVPSISLGRRQLLTSLLGLPVLAGLPLDVFSANVAFGQTRSNAAAIATDYANRLILIELKGGNDGLNTVIPFTDPLYKSLRPTLAIPQSEVLQLSAQLGLHPALEPLLALWQKKELAIVQGVGYPQPNLSHFRSIEIWDTASNSQQTLQDGWLTRTFLRAPVPAEFAAEGAIIGSNDLGPLLGGARAVTLQNTQQFLQQARLAAPAHLQGNRALNHLLKVEEDIAQAARQLRGQFIFKTEFPKGAWGDSIRASMQVLASGFDQKKQQMRSGHVPVMRLSLSGFDTHRGQLPTHANLLKQLAEGLVALRSGLQELQAWDSTVIMTYAEFGRRPKENQSQGTDHGTVNAHFITGGRVLGGLYGEVPNLQRLDSTGNLQHTLDFRSLYTTLLQEWWGIDRSATTQILGNQFTTLNFLRT